MCSWLEVRRKASAESESDRELLGRAMEMVNPKLLPEACMLTADGGDRQVLPDRQGVPYLFRAHCHESQE